MELQYTTQNPLRVFTAFSGYDSQCLALERLKAEYPEFDYRLVGWSEIDPYAIKAHDAIFPETAGLNFGNICQINWGQEVPDFDLFTYSFPCQSISKAGTQHGFAEGSGTKSSLLWKCRKAIEAKRPRYLLMENVKALVQKRFLPDFNRWCNELEDFGYTNFWQVLDAKDYEVPQSRGRVFMVSILCDETNVQPQYVFPDPMPLEKRLRDIMETEVDESFYLNQQQIDRIVAHCERKVAEGCGFKTNFQTADGISGAIKTKEGSREYDTYLIIPCNN